MKLSVVGASLEVGTLQLILVEHFLHVFQCATLKHWVRTRVLLCVHRTPITGSIQMMLGLPTYVIATIKLDRHIVSA